MTCDLQEAEDVQYLWLPPLAESCLSCVFLLFGKLRVCEDVGDEAGRQRKVTLDRQAPKTPSV